MRREILTSAAALTLVVSGIWSQANDTIPLVHQTITIDGEVLYFRVENGDTLLLADLADVSVTSFRSFESDADYRRYLKYRRYASSVYPYALEAVKLFKEVKEDTDGLKKRKRKRHVRHVQQDLKEDFTDPLKDLSRTQGKILVKMIERKLDTPMYDLLRNLRGGFTAGKWQSLGKLYGYDLKEGYIYGQDAILDAVLQDFEIKIDVEDR
jgi:hypothetical protein